MGMIKWSFGLAVKVQSQPEMSRGAVVGCRGELLVDPRCSELCLELSDDFIFVR